MELPSGELITESAIISQYAIDKNPKGGIQLYPSDPYEAAMMRITMDKFMSKLAAGYPMIMSRGENAADILKYKNEGLPMFEAICA